MWYDHVEGTEKLISQFGSVEPFKRIYPLSIWYDGGSFCEFRFLSEAKEAFPAKWLENSVNAAILKICIDEFSIKIDVQKQKMPSASLMISESANQLKYFSGDFGCGNMAVTFKTAYFLSIKPTSVDPTRI